MPIQYDAERRIFKLDSASTSYVLQIGPFDYLLHLYYGAKIPDTDLAYLAYTCRHSSISPRVTMDEPYFSKDVNRMEYSCGGCGDFRGSALSVLRACGTADTDIRYISHRITRGKPRLPGLPATYAGEDEADTLEILCRDAVSGAEVSLFYTVFSGYGAMTRHAVVRNASEQPLELQRVMSACVDFHDARDMDVIHLWGSWARERTPERVPLPHGTLSVSSKRGCSSHTHNPFLALCSHDATEESGDAYGFHLVYSGNFLASAEMDADGGARVLLGIHPEGFLWRLEPGESFCTPEAVMVYSDQGLGGMSRILHRLYREHLCRGPWKTRRRPILVNNWEATYFDFDEEKLCALAKTAAGLGIEMLVMDDGWFGARNSDRAGLGDWYVNESKLRGGLGRLTARLREMGMKFGIWFEPEMVSRDSDLFRRHPDWALQTPGREMSIARHQYVLDMSRADVRDYLFDCMKRVLDSADVAYIKWDFNRNLTEVGSALLPPERQRETAHRYMLGVYELLERLLTAFPHLLLEGCSGGGGRFDAGMLYYSPQIWTSDLTDAWERAKIQWGTSLGYPLSSMSCHVSACPNCHLKRVTPLSTRGAIASLGATGYELDISKMTDEELIAVKEQIKQYRAIESVILGGDLYRLYNPLETNYFCEMVVSKDKWRAYVAGMCSLTSPREFNQRVFLKGLDGSAQYEVEELGITLSGNALMNAGLFLPRLDDFGSFVWHLQVVEK